MAKKKIENYVFRPGMSYIGNMNPNAYASIAANKEHLKKELSAFINRRITVDTAFNYYPEAVRLLTNNINYMKYEVVAWIQYQITNSIAPFTGYTYDSAKCLSDVTNNINAYIHDLRYGGNEETRRIAGYYWIGSTPQVDGPRTPEVAAYTFLNSLIQNYILTRTAAPSYQLTYTQYVTGPSAEVQSYSKLSTLIQVTKDVIANGLSSIPTIQYKAATYENYTYSNAKCERDFGFVLDAYLNDLRYDGTEAITKIVKVYYDNDTLQVDGSGMAEVEAHRFVRERINSNIIENVIGTEDYPEAVRLLTANKTYLQHEVTAWIQDQVNTATKCVRDIGYLLDGVQYDIALATNYNAVFLGLAEYNALENDFVVLDVIRRAGVEVAALPGVAASTAAVTRSTNFFNEVRDIAQNGRSNADVVTFTNPSSATTSQIAAKDRLIANKNFIAAEINAWVGETYPTHNHDEAKCTRDVKYAIDALCYDILYGGNSATYDQAKFFFYGNAAGSPGIDPTHRLQTVAAYGRLKTIVGQIVTGATVTKTTTGTTPNTLTQVTSGTNAIPADATILQDLVQITADVVACTTQSQANTYLAGITKTYPSVSFATTALQTAKTAIATAKSSIISSVVDFNGYTFDTDKCLRDSGYVIDGYIYDLQYNGSEETYRVVTKYYYGNEAQVDGDRYPEAYAHTFLRNLINNYILPRVAAPSYQISYLQDLTGPSAESGATARITTLSDLLINLLLVGTSSLPAYPSYRTVPYQTATPQVVLTGVPETTAATKIVELSNIVINVIPNGLSVLATAVPNSYGRIKFQGKNSSDDLLLITNTTTNEIIYNFSNASTGGTVTIEELEDEDFVKFLQATDGVTTIKLNYDTSAMNEDDDIQIFIETPNMSIRPYDFGTDAIERMRVAPPQAMLDADFEYGLQPTKWQAIAVARGYPSIYEVPGTDQDVISIVSDASAGTSGIGGSLITVTTNSVHGFSVGQPVTVRGLSQSVSGVSRAEGSFIITSVPSTKIFTYYAKARVGTSNPTTLSTTFTQVRQGGFYTGAEIGSPTFSVISNGTSGTVTTALAVPSASNRFAFTGTAPEIGAPISGSNLATGSQVTSVLGTGGVVVTPSLTADYSAGVSQVNVASTSGVQVGLAVNDGAGNGVFITEINGLTLTLSDPLAASIKGNTVTYSGVSGTNLVGTGSSATFNIQRDNTLVYASVALNSSGTGYEVGDTIAIPGTSLGGSSPANDAYLNVDAIGGGGSIVSVSLLSYSVANAIADQTVTGIDSSIYTTSAAGTGAVFSVTRAAGYTGSVTTAGSNYSFGESFTVPGTTFTYGATPANDVTITVAKVAATYTSILQDSTTGGGSAAEFTIVRNGADYSVTLTNPGSGYNPADTLTIQGTQLGGATPANDLTITVVNANITGGITEFTSSGAASNVSGAITEISVTGTAVFQVTYTAVSGTNIASAGHSATFDVLRTASTYTISAISTQGTGYAIGNRITLLGTSLGGASPANDVVLTVSSLSGSGIATVTVGTHTAAAGTTFSLYSAITVSEFTTGIIPVTTTLTYAALATIRIDFLASHGIPPGGAFIVVPSSDNGVNNHTLAGGSYTATNVPTATALSYQARASGTISGTITGKVYARPDSFFTHRPFDGGVQLGTGGPQHGVQAIRQSKKYIRYQSGKGMMYTTGALFAPSYDIQNIVSDGIEVGSTITITLDENDHGFQAGAVVRISGVVTAGYDSGNEFYPGEDYTVDEVVSERVFRVKAVRRLGSKIPTLGFNCQVSTLQWKGAVVRAGAFDDQNGVFWEYNGTELAVVQRTATKQLAGTISMTPGSNAVTGINSRFLDQCKAGDFVVVKGMTHVVTSVNSNTSMTVNPDFRGVSAISGTKICLVFDKRVPQSQFNRDKLDGTGASGYNVDITKMQMIGIQYTWYGAGFIDFMLRGPDGNFVFAHRMRNSNVNTEAFMRTGNLPVRYEVANYGPAERLTSDITAIDATIPIADTMFYPDTGVVYIDNELVSYSGKTATALTGCTRSAQLTNFQSGALRSYRAGIASSHTSGTGVILLTNTTTPLISHWGSAFLTDGRFDEDRGYLFSYTSTGNSISTTKRTVFLIRLAPSVSNAVTGDLGERELLNRAQLLLKEISISSDTGAAGGLVVEGVLNPQNYPTNPSDISWGKLSGLAQGGQPSFAQIAPGGSVNWAGGGSYTYTTATALGTITGNATVPTGTAFNRSSGSTIAYVTRTSWDSIAAVVGQSVNDAKFPSGTTVSGKADSPTPVATTLPLLSSNAQRVFSVSSGSFVLYYYQASWQTLQGSTVATDIFTNDTSLFADGTYVTAVTGPTSGYYTVSFSTATLRNSNNNEFNSFRFAGARAAGNTIHFFQQASWASLPVDVIAGQTTNDAKFGGGTQISSVSSVRTFAGTSYYAVTFNAGNTSTVSASGTVTFNTTQYYTLTFSRASTSAINNTNNITFQLAQNTANTSYVYFTQASWEASGAAANTEIATTETKFPAGTRVQSVSTLQTFAGTPYYTVTFTQSSNAVIAGTNTVQFQFGNPPYALPGETIFSFITNPGSTDALNLTDLKELTTTALGGRGTFPNGPDVLAVNVYKTSGTAVNANLILRWSEAQA